MTVQLPLLPTNQYSTPSIDINGELCCDGLDKNDKVEFLCGECGQHLFSRKDLNWTQGGYWIAPQYTLRKRYYNSETGIITCPLCYKRINISFFSYMG